jgi:hypothetical protein
VFAASAHAEVHVRFDVCRAKKLQKFRGCFICEAETLRALITRNGGELIDWHNLE